VDKTSSYSADASHDVSKSFEAEYSVAHESSSSASEQSSSSKEASHAFEEVGSSSLAATVTFTRTHAFIDPVTNSATLSNSLNGSDGNIGVNIASGSSNQQLNTLAVAVGCNACNN
jgi:hypothetical protein